MVYKKSEYQNQFKACVIKKNHEDYVKNMNLRYERRDREYMHTPLVWGDSGEEDTTSSESNDEALSKVAQHQKTAEAEEQFQSIAEILTDSKLKLEAFKQSKHSDAHTFVMPEMEKVAMREKETQTKSKDLAEQKLPDSDTICLNKDSPSHPKCQASKVNQAEILSSEVKQTQEKLQKTNDMRNSQFNLRRKPYSTCKSLDSNASKKKFLHVKNVKSRPGSNEKSFKRQTTNLDSYCEAKVPPLLLNADQRDREDHLRSSQSSHRLESKLVSSTKPPFISYGIGDVEDCVSMHRTHNVKALVDVYPTALKAKLRWDRDKKKEREKSATFRSTDVLLDKLSGSACRDSSSWESEYSKQFHGYEPKDYERALSARVAVPRCTSIPGVHRHGCLVVHVD